MTGSNTLSTSNELQLSAKGLQNVACIPMENDFTFIVQFRKYQCNRFFAAYISPYISRLLRADPNINSFEINIDDPDEYFKDVLKLMLGQKISVTPKNMRVLHKVGTILGNSELVSCIDSLLHSPPDLKNCVDVISGRYAFNLDITEYSTFIAKNIDKIPENDLQRLKPELLYQILSSPELKYSQDDWLAKFVTSSVSTKGDSYRCLIQVVDLEKVSHGALTSFLQIVKADDMNESMLKHIIKKIPKENAKTMVFKDSH